MTTFKINSAFVGFCELIPIRPYSKIMVSTIYIKIGYTYKIFNMKKLFYEVSVPSQ